MNPGPRALPLLCLALVLAALVVATRTPSRPWQMPPQTTAATPRNLLLISLDTLRADHLGAWGYPRNTSPRLDELAARSVVFRRAVAQAGSTIPSHGSLFTSQYPAAVTNVAEGLSAAAETLAEVLQRQGFATWGFVDGANVRAEFGFAQGFDHYEDDRVGVRRLINRAKRWIRGHPAPRFFLFLHTYDIHTPYKAARPYVALFGDPDYRGGFRPDTRYFRAAEKRAEPMGKRERDEVIARYDAGIRSTDQQVGHFLDWLGRRGLLEDTLVVVVSDHGEEFLEHGRFGHQQLYLDPNLRVPLLFHHPSLRPRTIDQTVELTNVAPTVLEMLGVSGLPSAVGSSLAPWLRGAEMSIEPIAYAEKGGRAAQRTVVTDRYQLLSGGARWKTQLYDLLDDPDATRDISSKHPEVTAKLYQALRSRHRQAVRTRRTLVSGDASRKDRPGLREKVRRELEVLGYLEP